jgi:hypothetical protein
MSISKKKEMGKTQKQSNSRANDASFIVGVEDTLFFRTRFFGS